MKFFFGVVTVNVFLLEEVLEPSWVAVIGAVIAALSAFFVARLNNAGKREGALIEQLQEEVVRLNARLDAQEELILKLHKESMDSSVYVAQLQQHIWKELPPPPPPFVKE